MGCRLGCFCTDLYGTVLHARTRNSITRHVHGGVDSSIIGRVCQTINPGACKTRRRASFCRKNPTSRHLWIRRPQNYIAWRTFGDGRARWLLRADDLAAYLSKNRAPFIGLEYRWLSRRDYRCILVWLYGQLDAD